MIIQSHFNYYYFLKNIKCYKTITSIWKVKLFILGIIGHVIINLTIAKAFPTDNFTYT